MLKELERWKRFAELDEELRQQLNDMEEDETELEDAFSGRLSFGTGGIRGKLGPGPNRMNIYTVRRAVKGLAEYLKRHVANYDDRGVVIAYDSRHQSKRFALEAAKVLGANGIKTHLFESIQPTPLLSFTVRHLGAAAGIMITASHNPPEYNGMKVYNEKGSQITLAEADEMIRLIDEVEDELAVETKSESLLREQKLLNTLYDDIAFGYLEQISQLSKWSDDEKLDPKSLRIVYTPLHGTATKLVENGLKQLGFKHVHIVEEQAVPDPDFKTVQTPNPEEKEAFALAIELGEQVDADILLATDPDADRLGVAVKNALGGYELLTGNQLGALLLDYTLEHMDEKFYPMARMIKTIVTSELGRAIASSYGVKTIDTLTGFKYIAQKINEFETTGETFVFGYEESYGYLLSASVRDKDGIQAALIACEIAEKCKQEGKTLLDKLDELYERHGWYKEAVESLTLEGAAGQKKINSLMERFRKSTIKTFGDLRALYKEDYLKGEKIDVNDPKNVETLYLPKENVVKYILENNCWVCLRPSGTEPKIKWYYGAYGRTESEAEARLDMLKHTLREMIIEEKHMQMSN